MKKSLLEATHVHHGSIKDLQTFLDQNGNPMELTPTSIEDLMKQAEERGKPRPTNSEEEFDGPEAPGGKSDSTSSKKSDETPTGDDDGSGEGSGGEDEKDDGDVGPDPNFEQPDFDIPEDDPWAVPDDDSEGDGEGSESEEDEEGGSQGKGSGKPDGEKEGDSEGKGEGEGEGENEQEKPQPPSGPPKMPKNPKQQKPQEPPKPEFRTPEKGQMFRDIMTGKTYKWDGKKFIIQRQRSNKLPKKEKEKRDVHIYMDDATGDLYIFNGTELVKIGNKTPQIGDRGDDEYQSKEEEERKAQIERDKEEYGDEEEEETEEERQARLDDIKNALGDDAMKAEIEAETDYHVNRELARKKAAKDAAAKASSPIQRFRESLKKFIANQIQRERDRSWKREDPSYEGSGLIRPGRITTEDKKIPRINVYFDQSASWGDSDVKAGMEAIGILNNYVKRGEITIYIYYFANHIHSNQEDAVAEGGTHAGAELIEHIQSTRPDNVIVMTDGDFDWTGEIAQAPVIKVPGAVWFLFRREESQLLQQHLQGKRQTRKFMI